MHDALPRVIAGIQSAASYWSSARKLDMHAQAAAPVVNGKTLSVFSCECIKRSGTSPDSHRQEFRCSFMAGQVGKAIEYGHY
jgi:hypothetical protein